MAYGDFKNLSRRFGFDKLLHDKAFDIFKNRKCDGYQEGLASIVNNLLIKKSSAMYARAETLATRNNVVGNRVKSDIISDKQLPEQLYKPIIRKFETRKV